MDFINKFEDLLKEDTYQRNDPDVVDQAINRLNVNAPESFILFYKRFEGPFWEETLGMELLDLVESNDNIESLTCVCREEYSFPDNYLVLTEMNANEVIVLDASSDKVFRVDFEGGDEKLKSGKLNPEWNSFEEFLMCYFDIAM